MNRLILAAALAGLLVPAASAENCLWADQIDGFHDAKKDSVVLTQGGQDYLAEVMGECIGLQWAESIATDAHTQCLEAGDALVFIDNGNMHRRCLISKLTKIEKPAPKR